MNLLKKMSILILITVLLGLFFLQYKFKTEIKIVLDQKLPSTVQLEYANIRANVFSGNITLDSLSAKISDIDKNIMTSLNSKSLRVTNFSLWQFVFNETIFIEEIIFENANLQYHQNDEEKVNSKDSNSNIPMNKEIRIGKFSFVNGSLKVTTNKKDSLIASIDSINFEINAISTNANKRREKIPFNYKDYIFNGKQIFIKLSEYEDLIIAALSAHNDKLKLDELYIQPKFTKLELSNSIKVERDYLQLHIPELAFNGLLFGFNDSKFYLSANTNTVMQPILKVYRDKRIADDLSIKNMYSKMLRQLPFKLNISELKINQGYISYSEKVEDNTNAGEIFFENVNATITHFSNIYKEGNKTHILAESDFMGKAPMNLDIRFDVNDKDDAFLATGQFKNLHAEIANSYIKSNLNAKAEGKIEELYFTFSGNTFSSKGDFKMKYKKFKFEIINKKNDVNKLLTFISNLFINDGSKADNDGYRHGNIAVERDNTKSFFNYLWINVQDGLISTLIGKGGGK